MSVVVITPPQEVVSLAMAKLHLRVDHDDDDYLIAAYVAAAQGTIDGPSGWLGRAIGIQELELRLDGFGTPIWAWQFDTGGLFWNRDLSAFELGYRSDRPSRIELPFPPLISVTSVTYEDKAGVQQTLPSASYLATDEGIDASYGTTFPTGRWEANAVRVLYRAGYETTPPAIVAAILLMTGDLYDNRASVETGLRAASVSIPMSTTVETLLSPFRVFA